MDDVTLHGMAVNVTVPDEMPETDGAKRICTACLPPGATTKPGAGDDKANPGGKLAEVTVIDAEPSLMSSTLSVVSDVHCPRDPKSSDVVSNLYRTSGIRTRTTDDMAGHPCCVAVRTK